MILGSFSYLLPSISINDGDGCKLVHSSLLVFTMTYHTHVMMTLADILITEAKPANFTTLADSNI